MLQGEQSRLVAGLAIFALACSPSKASVARPPVMHLIAVGPRLISNQTSQPIAIYASGLRAGARLHLGAPFNLDVPVAIWDQSHGYARLAGLAMQAGVVEQTISASLLGDANQPASGEATLTVVNDAGFADLIALTCSPDGRFAFAISGTTDELIAVDLAAAKVTVLPTGDGPAALASWTDPEGRAFVAVAHRFSPELHLVRFSSDAVERRILPAPAYAMGLAIDQQRGVAYVAEHALDTVAALKLTENGRLLDRKSVV